MNEQDFIDSIASNPTVEHPYREYADWLSRLGDFRGEYLQMELDWFRQLTPDRPQQQLLSRLSAAAQAVPALWLTKSSRLLQFMMPFWNDLSSTFTRQPIPQHARDQIQQWEVASASLRGLFLNELGRDTVSRHFLIPADYLVFMLAIGSRPDSYEDWEQDWFAVWDVTQVLDYAESDSRSFASSRHRVGENSGIWLRIARYHDDHHYFLCCDNTHPLFGAIISAIDAHPWLNGWEGMHFIAPTFLLYIADYLPTLLSNTNHHSSIVSAFDWLTLHPAPSN